MVAQDELSCLATMRIVQANTQLQKHQQVSDGTEQVDSDDSQKLKHREHVSGQTGSTGELTMEADPYSLLPPTQLLFLYDSYKFECEADVLICTPSEVLLSATVFHPQGGGQPRDEGTIIVGDCVFEIDGVRSTCRQAPKIVHQGSWRSGKVPTGSKRAKCCIDERYRRMCARIHSAGHAIDAAMSRAQRSLPPTKGYHWPDGGAYVEYDGTVDDVKGLSADLNRHLADIVTENSETKRYVNPKTGDRIIEIAGMACPCGGTHVHFSGELGTVTVTKIKTKSRKLRISYSVSQEDPYLESARA